SAWMEGEALDIQRLLYTPEGKPRIAILSIAHLTDAERMFFVTIVLSEVISWMRSQPGTSSLRAILYMDEVFGYFPPSANPPSKTPMLTLLKQARAFGLGVVLATQNPVDLDYKGLANCGTWLLGRLQTERDKLRVLDGLEGAQAAAGAAFDRQAMERILSGLGNRVFLMNNVHEDVPVVFQTRWALSYLRGPLTRDEISRLMAERKATVTRGVSEGTPTRSVSEDVISRSELTTMSAEPRPIVAAMETQRPVLPPEIVERFASRRANLPPGAKVLYKPALLGQAKMHYAQATAGVDAWQDVALLLAVAGPLPPELWATVEGELESPPDLEDQPEAGAGFAELPGELSRPKRYSELATALKDYLYRNRKLSLWKCAALKQTSEPGETEAEFRIRLGQLAREARDEQVENLRQKYGLKIAGLQERIRKAEMKVEKEKAQAQEKTWSAFLSAGTSVLGALLGRKWASTANMTRAASAARAGSRAFRERQDIADATEDVKALQEQLAALEATAQAETTKVQDGLQPDNLELSEIQIAPKKSEINVSGVTLVWQPSIVGMDGVVKWGV
ncbi:MAG TPA: ATP-binding protein, partial [Pirellulaceae bacterium]|nr:ATP-binding protein [Pirellulaceae bacterium]